MAAQLVTLQQAKDHLQQHSMPVGAMDEPDVILKLEQAEVIILNFLAPRADPAWVSPETAPKDVTAAILVMLVRLREDRGDHAEGDADLWDSVTRILRRRRNEAIA